MVVAAFAVPAFTGAFAVAAFTGAAFADPAFTGACAVAAFTGAAFASPAFTGAFAVPAFTGAFADPAFAVPAFTGAFVVAALVAAPLAGAALDAPAFTGTDVDGPAFVRTVRDGAAVEAAAFDVPARFGAGVVTALVAACFVAGCCLGPFAGADAGADFLLGALATAFVVDALAGPVEAFAAPFVCRAAACATPGFLAVAMIGYSSVDRAERRMLSGPGVGSSAAADQPMRATATWIGSPSSSVVGAPPSNDTDVASVSEASMAW